MTIKTLFLSDKTKRIFPYTIFKADNLEPSCQGFVIIHSDDLVVHDKKNLSEEWIPSTVLRLRLPVSTRLRSEGSLNVAIASGKALAMPKWKARNWDLYALVGATGLFVLGVAVALPVALAKAL